MKTSELVSTIEDNSLIVVRWDL